MPSLSKFVQEQLCHCNCANDLMHPNGCMVNAAYNIYRFLVSNGKYFAPLLFLRLATKIRNPSEKHIKQVFKNYLHTVVDGVAAGWYVLLMICLFRRIFGRFGLYTFLFWPSIVGSTISSLCFAPKTKELFFPTMSQLALESILLMRRNFFTKLIADSATAQTFLFMCCSAIILQAKRYNLFEGFWFLTPEPAKFEAKNFEADFIDATNDVTASNCAAHAAGSCVEYFKSGARNYFLVGLCLDVAKMLFSSTAASGSKSGLIALFCSKLSNFKPQSTLFLLSYVGIYRFTQCFLYRKFNLHHEYNHILAAFLGGASYSLCPNLTLECFAIATTIRILWKQLLDNPPNKCDKIWKFLRRLPMAQMLFIVSTSMLIHLYALENEYVCGLGGAVINGITDNYAKRARITMEQRFQAALNA